MKLTNLTHIFNAKSFATLRARCASPAARLALFAALAALVVCTFFSPSAVTAIGKLWRGGGLNSAPDPKPAAAKPVAPGLKKSASTFRSAKSSAPNNSTPGTSNLNLARQGHAAVQLEDGHILIVGGQGQNGPVKESEIFNPATRSFTIAANSIVPRTEHAATKLNDGRILVTGGRNQAALFRSTELYDYNGNNFTIGAQMNRARTGHTATLLNNGKVLIVGGEAGGTLELYDPGLNRFTFLNARLATPRSFHSALLMPNGKVLIAGGQSANGAALNSAEIFDPVSQTVSPTRNQMRGARVNPTLNALPDGKVQVIGGDNNSTMEMYNAEGRYFTAYARLTIAPLTTNQLLSTPGRAALIHRRNRPNNATDPTTGQAAAAASIEAAEDPLDRDNATITDSGDTTLVAGGVNSGDQTLNTAFTTDDSPATVTTDKTDYHPGETITITGSGFQAGEIVTLTLHRNNDTPDTVLSAEVDGDGNFTDSQYIVQETDRGLTFLLTAVGQSSGIVAETAFTDATITIIANTLWSAISPTPTAGDAIVVKNNVTLTVDVSNGVCGSIQLGSNANPDKGDGTLTFNSGSQVTVSATTLSGNVVLGDTPKTGTINMTAGGTLKIEGAFTLNSGVSTLTAGTGTVEYSGAAAQTVTPATYNNLVIGGSNTKTLSGAGCVVGGTMTVNGTFAGGASNITITNLTTNNGGTFNWSGTNPPTISGTKTFGAASTFNYTRNSAQNVGAYGYGHLTLSGSGTKTLQGATTVAGNLMVSSGTDLNHGNFNATVSGTLNLQGGNVTTGSGVMIIASGGSVSRTSGYIVGSLRKTVGSTGPAQSFDFEVGTASGYNPVNVTFANVQSAPGTLTARANAGDHASIGSSTLNASKSVNVNWTLTNSGIGFNNYQATFNFNAGDLDAGTNTANLAVGKFDSPSWSYPTVGTRTATSTQATGMTSFSDFAVAESACTAPSIGTSPSGATKNIGESVTFSVTASGTAPLSYQWRKNTVNIGGATSSSYTISSVGSADAGSYDVVVTNSCGSATSSAATLTVNKATLTVSGITASNKTYDGGTTATLNTASAALVGLVSGHTNVTLNTGGATGAFDNKNVGTGKTVTVAGLTISGTDAGDYNLTQPTTTANITAKGLTVTGITASNKVYDGNTTATLNTGSAALVGVVGGDSVTLNTGSAAGAFANANVGTGKTVTVSGLTISGGGASNYTLTQPTTTADITAKGLTITGVVANNKVYDGNTSATLNTGSAALSGVVGGDSVTLDSAGATGAFNNKNVGTSKPVTASGFAITGTGATNYSLAQPAGLTANITAKGLTISGVTANSKIYDATLAATLNTGSAALVGAVGGDAVALNSAGATATFADKNVGTGKPVTASGFALSGGDAGNYTLAQPSGLTADITARALTVSATGVNKVYNGNTTATVTLSDNRVSGDMLTTSYTTAAFTDKNVGTGQTVNVSGISIGGTDANNYTANTTATTTADITARALTVSATGVDKVYDGTAAATVTLSDNRVGGDVLTTSYTTASFADKNVGAGKAVSVSGISISGTDAGNYTANTTAATTASITARALTVSATGVNKVYDGNTNATVTLSDNRVVGDVLTTSYTSASFANKNVGTGKTVSVTGISVSGADVGNYTFNTTASTTANITARTLTVSATGVNKVYDGTTAATVTLSDDRVGGDTLTTSYTSAAFDNKNVGTGKTVNVSGISISGADSGNYALASTTATATANITPKALTVSATGINKVYDGTTAATVSLSDNRVLGDSLTASYTSANFADKNVGVGKTVSVSGIAISGADSGNYTANATASTTASITALAITGSITANDKVYDGNTSATINGRSLTGVIFGDVVSYTGGTATFDTRNVGTGKTVTATGLGLSGADAGNYTVNSTAATTASISAKAITGSITAASKTYDGTTAASILTRTLAGVVGGDSVTYSGGSATFDNKNVGMGKTVTATGLTLTGGDAGNYTVNSTATTTANITAASLTGSITADNKVYDGNTSATILTRTLAGVLGSDVVSYVGGTATFANKSVGTGKTVTGSGLSLSGADAGNYTVNASAGTTADITALAITGSITANNRVYDGTTAATIATRTLAGVIGGDAVTYSGGTATFSDKHVGTGKTVSATGLSLTGADAGNYTVNSTAATTANITVRTLTLTAAANTKVYDGNTSAAATPTVGGLQTGDSVTGLTETYATPTVGTGKTLSVATYTVNDGNSGNNYTVSTVVSTSGVITAAGTAVTSVTVTSSPTQYSDKVNLSATTSSSPGIGGSLSFYINYGSGTAQLLGTVGVAANGSAGLTGVALLETVAGSMSPGAHTVTAVFTPSDLVNYATSQNSAPLTITAEDAVATYSGPTYFSTASPTSMTATVTLSATVVDAADGARGDIRNAKVEFRLGSLGGTLVGSANLAVGLVSAGDTTTGTATTTFTYTLSGSEVNSNGTTLNVNTVVKNYYTNANESPAQEPAAITITIPGTDSVNGGGHMVMSSSNGQYAGATGSKMNFGFTMKYNNSGKNLQGQANIIIRTSDGKVYQIKSDAVDSLAVSGTTYPKGGTFVTKANLTDITNPLAPIAIGGNLKLQVEMTDAATGGQTDKVSITLFNSAGGLFFSSFWDGTKTIQQLLGGGNISVR